MPTELIPLLNGIGSPPSGEGSEAPPVVADVQELADWLYDQLGSTSPTLNTLGIPSLSLELLRFLVGVTVQDTTGILPRVGAIFNILDVLAPTFEYLANPAEAEAPSLAETVGSGTGITIPDRFDTLAAALYAHTRIQELDTDLASPEWVAGTPLGFTGETLLEESADLYRLQVLNPEDYRQRQGTAGPDRLHRLGWWVEVSGSMVGERKLVEWEDQMLHMNGHRMRGVLVKVNPAINCTITPYTLIPG